MSSKDPFAPLSIRRKIGYIFGGTCVVLGCALVLGSLEDGLPIGDLLKILGIVAIPLSLILISVIWLGGGKKSETAFGSANVKMPARLIKALPWISAIIAAFFILRLLGTL